VALSTDGNTALIGGINDANVGAAWVFTRASGKWTQQGNKLTGGIEETGSGRFGKSVALSGDGSEALVGAYFDSGSIGAAWAFKRSGSTWSHDGKKLTGAGEEGFAQFGFSVALSFDGKTALVGGPADEGSTKEAMAGAAWGFGNGSTGWTAEGSKLTSGGAKGVGELGTSVALSAEGNTALVGAPGDDEAGGVRAYQRSGATWSPQGAELEPSDATGPAGFGTAVALSGDGATALIGGPVDEDGPMGGTGPTPSGAVWQFARSGSSWSQQGTKIVGTTSESEFGAAVALTADTQTALIGGPIDSTGTVPDAGAFWVYVNPAAAPPQGPFLPMPITSTSVPSKVPAVVRPLLANVSQSHARWRAGSAAARLVQRGGDHRASSAKSKAKAKVRRPPLGTTFSFTLNTAASVQLTFTRKVAGREVKGRCKSQNASNKRKPPCKRTISPLAFRVSAKAGAQELSFQGSAAGKKLSPGTYTVTLVASNAGLSSAPKLLTFTIVR
jgi:FG-GAP repeat